MFIEVSDGKKPMLLNIDHIECVRELENGTVIVETDVVANNHQNFYTSQETYNKIKNRIINLSALTSLGGLNELK